MNSRENWSGQLGFILAAAASAVGLGNLWRFPASAATYGGGIFLIAYLILFFGFGVFLLMTEIAIGRATKLSPVEAFRTLNRKWVIVGILGTLVPFGILPYYSVIGGWVTKYFAQYFFASLAETAADNPANDAFFSGFIGDFGQAFSFCCAFAGACFAFILMGVKKGIERSNKILMPALLILTVGIALFTALQPNAREGLKYFFIPDFNRLSVNGSFSPLLCAKTILAAMGQMFFSLSLAMGIMITYGSYLPRSANLPKAALRIGICDTFVAFLAGVIVIPPAFAFGGEELARSAGPGLMFVSLPKVFAAMPCTRIVALAFFALCLFAALTSCISIAETCVASVCDRLHWSRRKGTLVVAAYTLLAAFPSAWSLGFLDKADYVTNNILMPICAFLTVIFVGWVIGPEFIRREITADGEHAFRFYGLYRVLMRYAAPILIGLIFVTCVFVKL